METFRHLLEPGQWSSETAPVPVHFDEVKSKLNSKIPYHIRIGKVAYTPCPDMRIIAEHEMDLRHHGLIMLQLQCTPDPEYLPSVVVCVMHYRPMLRCDGRMNLQLSFSGKWCQYK